MDMDSCSTKDELRSAHRSQLPDHRKLVGRGGFGMFYNSFENQGYGPNIGENYPFVFNFGYGVNADPSDPHAGIVSQVAPVSFNTAFPRLLHGWSRRHRGLRVRVLLHPI